MRAWYRWSFIGALCLPVIFACSSKSNTLTQGQGDDDAGDDDDGGSGSSGGSSGSGSSSGGPKFMDDNEGGNMVAASDCKAGRYQGTFTGHYSSHLIFGIPLDVSGDVNLTLNQAGKADEMCMVAGEGFVLCSDVFTLSGGTITGVANKAGMIGDASVGGYPYFCSMTGTVDCAKKKLVNGWIQCTYCAFDQLTDGGAQCDGANVGGHFAGPLIADYDTMSHAFTNGTWNGSEALAGNNGMMPGPDGGPISQYLVADGGYGVGVYGGAGNWNSTLK